MVNINTLCLIAAAALFARSQSKGRSHPEYAKYFRLLRVCGVVFVFVALYRSVFVSSYPGRLAWFNIILNSPFVVRCFACFAEMSFIGMIAAILTKLNRELSPAPTDRRGVLLSKTPLVAVAFIFIAQFFAFGGLITQRSVLFAIEEALWAAAFISIAPLVLAGFLKTRKKQPDVSLSCRLFFAVMAVWCFGYIAFQCFYALPFLYLPGLSADAGVVVPPDALHRAIHGYTATRDFDAFGGVGFFVWHTGYFTLCVWMSLLFMTGPLKKRVRL